MASRIHFKYWKNILILRFYEQFSRNDSAIAPEKNFRLLKYEHIVRRICAISQYNCAKNGKGLKLLQRKLIPYKSIIGLGAFRKIKYFGDILKLLLCI